MWLRGVALLLAACLSLSASAATFPINLGDEAVYLSQDVLGGSQAALYVYNSLDVDVYALSVVASNVTAFSFDPTNSQISYANSFFNSMTGELSIFGHLSGPLIPAHSGFLIGILQLSSSSSLEFALLQAGDAFQGGTIFNSALEPFADQTFFGRPCDAPQCAPVYEVRTTPEPESVSLVVSLGVLTYSALGGKIRRRNASAGEPK